MRNRRKPSKTIHIYKQREKERKEKRGEEEGKKCTNNYVRRN